MQLLLSQTRQPPPCLSSSTIFSGKSLGLTDTEGAAGICNLCGWESLYFSAERFSDCSLLADKNCDCRRSSCAISAFNHAALVVLCSKAFLILGVVESDELDLYT